MYHRLKNHQISNNNQQKQIVNLIQLYLFDKFYFILDTSKLVKNVKKKLKRLQAD
jgi:hypothetical protein